MGRRQPSAAVAVEPLAGGSAATAGNGGREPNRRPGGALAQPLPHAATRSPADPEAAARTACLAMLSARARTRAELMAGLRKRDIPDEVGARVLDRFTEVGLIDDAAFAAAFVSARHRERGLARDELSRQLRAKGVAADVVADAVSGIDGEVELAAARALITRKTRTMTQLPDHVRTRRLVALLARKGYSPQLCYAAVREVLGELVAGELESDNC